MTIRKFVGATARTMGSDPAYAAYPTNGPAAVFDNRDDAVYWLERHGDEYIPDEEDE
jgi:hypothetical protein